MRDEDLRNLPQSVERWRFRQMLEMLGFGTEQDNLRGFAVSYSGIHAVVYATDEKGLKYMTGTEEEPMRPVEAATHEIAIPFVGSWEKPINADSHGPTECTAVLTGSGGKILCERLAGHSEDHGARVDGELHRW